VNNFRHISFPLTYCIFFKFYIFKPNAENPYKQLLAAN